jgi:transmembrane sensor
MRYEDYGTSDFIKDGFFVEWVSNPNSKSNEFWTKWMSAHPDQVPTILQAQKFIANLAYDEFEALKEEEYIEMFENVLKSKPVIVSKSSVNRISGLWLRIAASVAIVLVSFGTLLWIDQEESEPVVAQEVVEFSKSNPIGQKSMIILPDGSKIKLNSGSSLTYNSQFGVQDRMVELKGEAFFDITENPELPFIIKSGELRTLVLGTAFNVRNYQGEENIQVLVVRGEVSVSDEFGSSFILNPNDILEYSHSDKNVKKSICVDFNKIIGWKDGILSFNDESFSEVVEKIRRWYGVEILLEDGFEVEGSYTGEYQNKSLEKVMDGISFTSKFEYSILTENKILIRKKR